VYDGLHLPQGSIGYLQEGNGVLGIAGGLPQSADLGFHPFGDGQSRGIIRGAVNPLPRGDALQGNGVGFSSRMVRAYCAQSG
jgi:hypothetical protein